MQLKRIFIIGAGNVATHLVKSLIQHVEVVGIYSLSQSSAKIIAERFNLSFFSSLDKIPDNDLVLVAVNDNAVFQVIQDLPSSHAIAYTSGSIELDKVKGSKKNVGVFYPLQTFSKTKDVDLSKVPFFIEATNESFSEALKLLAESISKSVSYATSFERKKMHIAAVFINNFTNHLSFLAKDYLDQFDIDFNNLKPLLKETVEKLMESNPYDAQTGPARRNDSQIIENHLSELEGDKKNIYKAITESILHTYHKKND